MVFEAIRAKKEKFL